MTKGLLLSFAVLGGLSLSTIVLSILIRRRFSKDPDTPTELIPKILELMKLERSNNFIDLGAGDFRMVNAAAKYCESFGIELSPLHLITAKIFRLFKRKRSHMITGNLLNTDLSKYDRIYLNLDHEIIRSISSKLPTKSGTIIFTLNDKLENLTATQAHELSEKYTLYEYHFK